jgi:protein transport protein SEC31
MEQVSKNINWDTGVEKIIKDNLVIGNYDGAIDCALKSGRSAEALLLAYSQGKDSFEQTMSAFLTS